MGCGASAPNAGIEESRASRGTLAPPVKGLRVALLAHGAHSRPPTVSVYGPLNASTRGGVLSVKVTVPYPTKLRGVAIPHGLAAMSGKVRMEALDTKVRIEFDWVTEALEDGEEIDATPFVVGREDGLQLEAAQSAKISVSFNSPHVPGSAEADAGMGRVCGYALGRLGPGSGRMIDAPFEGVGGPLRVKCDPGPSAPIFNSPQGPMWWCPISAVYADARRRGSDGKAASDGTHSSFWGEGSEHGDDHSRGSESGGSDDGGSDDDGGHHHHRHRRHRRHHRHDDEEDDEEEEEEDEKASSATRSSRTDEFVERRLGRKKKSMSRHRRGRSEDSEGASLRSAPTHSGIRSRTSATAPPDKSRKHLIRAESDLGVTTRKHESVHRSSSRPRRLGSGPTAAPQLSRGPSGKDWDVAVPADIPEEEIIPSSGSDGDGGESDEKDRRRKKRSKKKGRRKKKTHKRKTAEELRQDFDRRAEKRLEQRRTPGGGDDPATRDKESKHQGLKKSQTMMPRYRESHEEISRHRARQYRRRHDSREEKVGSSSEESDEPRKMGSLRPAVDIKSRVAARLEERRRRHHDDDSKDGVEE